MSAKKIAKAKARIEQLEVDLKLALQKKSSSATEINMPARLTEINRLKSELIAMEKS